MRGGGREREFSHLINFPLFPVVLIELRPWGAAIFKECINRSIPFTCFLMEQRASLSFVIALC